MSLIIAHDQQAFVHADAYKLERQLMDLDPRLYLKYKVVEHPKKGLGRRYEVWRHCEDGEMRMIGHWRLEEFDMIWTDVLTMRAGAEGRVDSVLDRIDKSNAKVEKDNHDEGVQVLGEMADHAVRLVHDRTQPKNVFRGIPGLRDEPKP